MFRDQHKTTAREIFKREIAVWYLAQKHMTPYPGYVSWLECIGKTPTHNYLCYYPQRLKCSDYRVLCQSLQLGSSVHSCLSPT